MAQKTVIQMVYNRLPFLAQTDGNAELISDFKQDTYYYLQPWTRITGALVEEDSSYTGLKRVLVAEITALNILTRRVMIEMGGLEGAAAEMGRRITHGKADVVDATFEYASASGGGALVTDLGGIQTELKNNIDNYAVALGYYLPSSLKKMPIMLPPFVAFTQ